MAFFSSIGTGSLSCRRLIRLSRYNKVLEISLLGFVLHRRMKKKCSAFKGSRRILALDVAKRGAFAKPSCEDTFLGSAFSNAFKMVSGAPGWLSGLSLRLRLRSRSHNPRVRAPHRALCCQLGAWSLLRILCLPLSLSAPPPLVRARVPALSLSISK